MFNPLNHIRTWWAFGLIALQCLMPLPAHAKTDLVLPQPALVKLSQPVNPSLLKGIKVFADKPFNFDFVLIEPSELHQSSRHPSPRGALPLWADAIPEASKKDEINRLVKYFLAGLTIPEGDLWVNLSPYEKNRIVPESFGLTGMGRDVLAQDYLLKQLTANLMHPDSAIGKEFWKRIYEEAKKQGISQLPVNALNKVWILPAQAEVYEGCGAHKKELNSNNGVGRSPKEHSDEGGYHNVACAYITKATLKVMLEEDYVASKNFTLQKFGPNATIGNVKQIIASVILPVIEKEVNEGANFATLRQVYNSLILSTWYKEKIKKSLIAKQYVNQRKVNGTSSDNQDPTDIETIYQEYIKSFKKGAYNLIREEPDPITGSIVPRKYFAGGLQINVKLDYAMQAPQEPVNAKIASVDMNSDRAMSTDVQVLLRENLIQLANQSSDKRQAASTKIVSIKRNRDQIASALIDNLINPVGIKEARQNFADEFGGMKYAGKFDERIARRLAREATLFTLFDMLPSSYDGKEYQWTRKFKTALAKRLNQEAKLWLIHHQQDRPDISGIYPEERKIIQRFQLGHDRKEVDEAYSLFANLRLFMVAKQMKKQGDIQIYGLWDWVYTSIAVLLDNNELNKDFDKAFPFDRAMQSNEGAGDLNRSTSTFSRYGRHLPLNVLLADLIPALSKDDKWKNILDIGLGQTRSGIVGPTLEESLELYRGLRKSKVISRAAKVIVLDNNESLVKRANEKWAEDKDVVIKHGGFEHVAEIAKHNGPLNLVTALTLQEHYFDQWITIRDTYIAPYIAEGGLFVENNQYGYFVYQKREGKLRFYGALWVVNAFEDISDIVQEKPRSIDELYEKLNAKRLVNLSLLSYLESYVGLNPKEQKYYLSEKSTIVWGEYVKPLWLSIESDQAMSADVLDAIRGLFVHHNVPLTGREAQDIAFGGNGVITSQTLFERGLETIKTLEINPQDTVLDIGSGKFGGIGLIAALMGAKVISYENNPEVIKGLKQKIDALKDKIRLSGGEFILIEKDFSKEDKSVYPLGYFDHIIATDVMTPTQGVAQLNVKSPLINVRAKQLAIFEKIVRFKKIEKGSILFSVPEFIAGRSPLGRPKIQQAVPLADDLELAILKDARMNIANRSFVSVPFSLGVKRGLLIHVSQPLAITHFDQVSLPDGMLPQEAWEKFHALHAASFDSSDVPIFEPFWANVANQLPSDAKVLDLGRGNFFVTKIMKKASSNINVWAVDYADLSIDKIPPGVTFFKSKGEDLDSVQMPSDFDAIVSQFAIEYMDSNTVLEKLSKRLKVGGKAIFLMHHQKSGIAQSAALRLEQYDIIKSARLFDLALDFFNEPPLVGSFAADPRAQEFVKSFLLVANEVKRRFAIAQDRQSRSFIFSVDILVQVIDLIKDKTTLYENGRFSRSDFDELSERIKDLRRSYWLLNERKRVALTQEQIQAFMAKAKEYGLGKLKLDVMHKGNEIVGWEVRMEKDLAMTATGGVDLNPIANRLNITKQEEQSATKEFGR